MKSEKGLAIYKRYHRSDKGLARDARYKNSVLGTARIRAIAESLVALFPELPSDGWRVQLAHEILNSSSGQTLCWVNTQLEDYIVEYTEETI
jgi:hypothetical protein